jgi:serine/threonine-protein kinase
VWIGCTAPPLRAELDFREDADDMLTTDLGACEWFVWDLRRSNLIDRGQLDQVIGEFLSKHPGAEPPALAEFLVSQGILTAFQADRLLQGKTQGFVLGPFTLMDSLGVGSMGTVYKSQSKTDNQWYAVKVLPRRSMWNVRIARRKVRAFEQCPHAAVVPFVDVGTSGGMHYLAWPLVEGETLDKIVEREGKLSPEQAALFGVQVAEGLDVCHQQELFHGLLKPSNLILGNDGQVRILDFGIGCLLAETEGESLVDTMSTANSVNSGLDCASPESIMDPTNLTPVGDQYSLGCCLYYFLCGQYPFPDGTAVEKMMCHQHKQPTPLKQLAPELPDGLVAVVEKLMAKAPQDRYVTAGEAAEALRPFAAETSTRRPGPGGARALSPSSRLPASSPVQPVQPVQPPPAKPPVAILVPPSRPSQPIANAEVNARLAGLRPHRNATTPPIAQPVPDFPVQVPGNNAAPPSPTWDQRLGPVGIALVAILAGAAAWLLSSFIK